jgi:hypothetical protein
VRLAGGEEVRADAVVCNADVVYGYRSLVDPAYRRKYPDRTLDRLEPGGVGARPAAGRRRHLPAARPPQ